MKQHINTLLIAIAIIVGTAVLGTSYSKKFKATESISVTGLGEEDFESDLIVWNASFSKFGENLKVASSELKADRERIKSYLVSKGVKSEDIVFSSVDISKEFDRNYDNYGNLVSNQFLGYSLNQSLRIESSEVNKIEMISREVTDLINQNIELSSMAPEYYFTKLAALKLKMIENATKDAHERADKIATNAGSSLGDLKNSSMGIIQITARNSSEDYSWGGSFNTSSKLKTASITIRLEYGIR